MVTIKDVALRAGVSLITVSRVVNTPDKVAKETRGKVEAAMKELGYVRNVAAGNLVYKRSGIICVYASRNFSRLDPFLSHFLLGVSEALGERSYSLSLVHEVNESQFCDGYIFSGYNEAEEAFGQCLSLGKPVALFGQYDDAGVDCIDTDNVLSARKAVRYLVENGHRRIAVVLNTTGADYVKQRFEGYRMALQESGIEYDSNLVVEVDNSTEGGREASDVLLGRGRFTACFLITDTMAVGFVLGLQAKGLSVPDDISVVGFDGLGHQNLTIPKITTVVQPVYEISKALAESMLGRVVDGRKDRVSKLVEAELSVAGSVRNMNTEKEDIS